MLLSVDLDTAAIRRAYGEATSPRLSVTQTTPRGQNNPEANHGLENVFLTGAENPRSCVRLKAIPCNVRGEGGRKESAFRFLLN